VVNLEAGLLLPKACSVQKVVPSSLVMGETPVVGVPRKYQLSPLCPAATTTLTLLLPLAPDRR
jgi:hypothetical protein